VYSLAYFQTSAVKKNGTTSKPRFTRHASVILIALLTESENGKKGDSYKMPMLIWSEFSTD
jgi:hypothetical protein